MTAAGKHSLSWPQLSISHLLSDPSTLKLTSDMPTVCLLFEVALASSAGIGAGTFHRFPSVAKFCCILSLYNKTIASQVNIDRSQVKVNFVLSME